MIVTGEPQFETQDNSGRGNGIPVSPEWLLELPSDTRDIRDFFEDPIEESVWDVFIRLRTIFASQSGLTMSSTQLHDINCFAIHRLLPTTDDLQRAVASPLTECLRYGIILYTLAIQGMTYYSHDFILDTLLSRFLCHMEILHSSDRSYTSADVWLAHVGMIASARTRHCLTFVDKIGEISQNMDLTEQEYRNHVQNILWLDREDSPLSLHWSTVYHEAQDVALNPLANSGEIGQMYKFLTYIER